ncbi:diguanylate cyclase [Actinoplanes sp. NPDC026619]|uniref:diguanylate cyclase n=1 Tax=Actinoplanes sp. NPDC026619 TaxID=3155798 RepID=UPI0033EEDB11
MATTDPLTGLPNRAACVDRIEAELRSGPDAPAVLYGDLDGFQPVNDRLGHAAGDDLLTVPTWPCTPRRGPSRSACSASCRHKSHFGCGAADRRSVALLRVYAVLAGTLTATYLVWPFDLRGWPFLVVTLSVLPAMVMSLRRAPRGARKVWWLQLASSVSYNVGNLIWIWLVTWGGRESGDGSAADVFLTAGGVLMLVSALVLVAQRGRGDVGGIIDAVITAVALSGLLWDAVMLPGMTDHGIATGQQVGTFLNLFVMAGTLGAMVRISAVADRRMAPVRLLTAGVFFAMLGTVSGALAFDGGIRADWTNNVYMAAYAALGCAALHPAVSEVISRGPKPVDDLSRGRLTLLAFMLALGPIIGGGRAIIGLPTDGVLIALSSAGLIPLVMVRIARLSTARREAERALRRLATSDPLTGLPNRAACVDRIDQELRSGEDGLAVLFCDLDGFKPVNDRLGHAAGDDLLIAVAEHLHAGLRGVDLVSRFGGDEFVVVCRGPGAVEAITDRIRDLAARELTAAGEQVRIGVSVGVAQALPGDGTDDVLTRADLAMYRAKKSKTIGALSLVTA